MKKNYKFTEVLKEVVNFFIKEVGYYIFVCEYEGNNIVFKKVMEKVDLSMKELMEKEYIKIIDFKKFTFIY